MHLLHIQRHFHWTSAQLLSLCNKAKRPLTQWSGLQPYRVVNICPLTCFGKDVSHMTMPRYDQLVLDWVIQNLGLLLSSHVHQ